MTTTLDELSADDALAFCERIAKDPVWYIESALGYSVLPHQRPIIESVRDNKITCVPTCHAVGKSRTAASIVHWYLPAHPYSLVASTAPTDRQVRTILWREIRKLFQKAPIQLTPEPPLVQEWSWAEDWYGIGFTTKDNDPTRFQGLHSESANLLVVADEASGIQHKIWDEGIFSILTGTRSRLLATGNPTDSSSYFHSLCMDEETNTVQISAFDTPNFTEYGITRADIETGDWKNKFDADNTPYPFLIDPTWVASRYNKWGRDWDESRTRSRILGLFPQDDPEQLFAFAWVNDATSNFERGRMTALRRKWNDSAIGTRRCGLDGATTGGDESVLYGYDGESLTLLAHSPKFETGRDCAQWAWHHMQEFGTREVNVDGIGLGDGIANALEDKGAEVSRFIASSSAPTAEARRAYGNLRAYVAGELAQYLQKREIFIDPSDSEIEGELLGIRKKRTGGKLFLESKDDMRRRGVASPNRADAAMMAIWGGSRTRFHFAED